MAHTHLCKYLICRLDFEMTLENQHSPRKKQTEEPTHPLCTLETIKLFEKFINKHVSR